MAFLALMLPLLLGFACLPARADVGIVLNDTLGISFSRFSGAGHSDVYFSRICPASPVKLRLCRPGEDGSVISNYINLGEDQPFAWNAVSLSMYLYGVEDPRFRPLVDSPAIKRALEQRYLDKFLAAYCTNAHCRTSKKAEWREMVGAELSRNIYIFIIRTSVEQDQALIAKLNSEPNRNHFNILTHNCANFTEDILDTYFPGAVGRDYLTDFGIATPKAIARSLVRYALRHPESGFRVLHFAQLPGTMRRSTPAREISEQLYASKKFVVPLAVFAPYELAGLALSYRAFGYFNPEHAFEERPAADAAQIEQPIQLARADLMLRNVSETDKAVSPADVVGTPEEWKQYKRAFDSIIAQAVRNGTIPNRGCWKHFANRLLAGGTVQVDGSGALWMEVSEGETIRRVGISASNVNSPASDPRVAYNILLACTGRELTAAKNSRETLPELKIQWQLLQDARAAMARPANVTLHHASGHAPVIAPVALAAAH